MRIAYDGWLIVEQDVIEDASSGAAFSPLEAARQSRAYLKQFLP